MIRFGASRFTELQGGLMRISIYGNKVFEKDGSIDKATVDNFVQALDKIYPQCKELGLRLSANKILELYSAIKAGIDSDKFSAQSAELYKRINEELESRWFGSVPTDRGDYLEDKWIVPDSSLAQHFPTATTELRAAGRCYAYGESNACVFHSMKAMEVGMNALAQRLGVPFRVEQWHVVIQSIESAVRQRSAGKKTPRRLKDDKFYGECAAHLFFVKNAWRNHVMHVREHYNDQQAEKILDRSRTFLEGAAERLRERR